MTVDKAKLVGWAVGPTGYSVQVLDSENQPIHEYAFGNNAFSTSTADSVAIDDEHAMSREELERYAQKTAFQIAEDLELPENSIFRDSDVEATLHEEYNERMSRLGF